MKLTSIIIIFLIISGYSFSEEAVSDKTKKWTISGTIRDKSNGEALFGATIYIDELKTGTSSDVYGNYSITVIEGKYTLVFSYIGYIKEQKQCDLTLNTRLNIELKPKQETLEEVEITSEKSDKNITRPEMSTFKMDIKTIQKIPSLMGEQDIIKAIQMLPGVQTVSEGTNGFSVRGGAPDQNLILLDDATVYNASHLMGVFSVFNNDAIKDVKLFKGDFPANYGGRLSSVLDVRMKEGNSKGFEVTGGVGIIASRLTVEGPIMKDKMSFIASGRRTYADIFLALASDPSLRNNKLYFYDFNAKLNYRVDDNNTLFISGYFGRDVFKNGFASMKWGNQTGTLRWNHLFSKKLFSNFTFNYSDYLYNLGTPSGEVTSFEWNSRLSDAGLKGDFSYYLNTNNTIRFGGTVIYHMIDPGMAQGIGDESVFTAVHVPHNYSFETAVYGSNEQKLGDHIIFKYGLRISMFQNIGPGTVYHYDSAYNAVDSTVYKSGVLYNTYAGLEPRLGLLYTLNDVNSFKASYSRTYQYLQLAQSSTVGTPLDIWFPASPNVKPQVADQVALGYFRNFRRNTIETSVEAYYKFMNHVIDFKDHAQLILNPQLEGELRIGTAYSYGAEFLVRLNEKKLNGWVSYTWSRTFRVIPEINDGNPYPAPYDKPNNLAVVVNYQISKRFSASANFIYATGSAVTFPTGRALIGGKIIPIYSNRNAYRFEDYNRLDLSVSFYSKTKPGSRFNWDLNMSVYNVYNRHNTWAINFLQESNDPNVTYAEKIYLFGIVPSITFNFHFK
jgi:hypothetical protein